MNTGDLLADRFEVGTLAGSGGMGRVFRALDRTTGERVAVKVIHSDDPRETARFDREARVLAELSHPGIVRYVAHGITLEGEPYLAMEWLEGEDLESRQRRQPLGVGECLRLARRVSEALAVAHARHVVHRDIKPSNLFLVGGDCDAVKVLDFGIARRLGASDAVTGTGGIIGTVGYMAPEQARGEASLDARADVFALGCVLYECIAGRAAFEGTQFVAVLMKILLEDPPSLCDVRFGISEELDALIARMLSKDPADRPADGGELARELSAFDASAAVTVPGAIASRPPPAALTRGEQRLLAVILAHRALREGDVADDVAATLTPDAVTREDPLVALRAAVEPYRARIDRLADGSVLATIAGTGSATDLTLGAARCALVMRHALPDVRIAMAIGRGNDAGRTAAGEVVECASKQVREAVAGGPVRVDAITAGLLDARFEVHASTRASDGVELLRERAADAMRTLLGRPTPFLGREREVKVLEGLWDECVAESTVRVVLVTAPAGAGKSRLRHEFLKRLGARGNVPAVWLSRGDPMYAGSSLRSVQQMLQGALRVSSGEDPALQRSQIEAGVARSVPAKDRQRVSEFLGQVLAVQFPSETSVQLRSARRDPRLMADQMLRAWEDFVDAELSDRPLLMVLEDLHWGDAASIAYVDSVMRICRQKSLMVLALARPEVTSRFQDLWTDRDLQRIPLGGLSRRSGERLVREMLGDRATDDLVARVVTQADGNAFYLEELIRAVADGRGDALPGTVAAMVHARIESLAPDARRVLRAASVFGEVFWDGALAALLGGARQTDVIRAALAQLEDKEVIHRLANPRFPGQHEYAFRHGAVRQVSYDTLMEADRVLGHKLAAQWLEQAGETDAASLAEHLENAGDRVGAIPWWLRAARMAFDANDLGGAIERAERGIVCGAQGSVRGELRLVQAEASRWRGDNEAAERNATEAAELIDPKTGGWARAVGEVGTCEMRRGRIEGLFERARQLEDAVAGHDVDPNTLVAAARLSGLLVQCGRLQEGLGLSRAVEAHAPSGTTSDPAIRARILATSALAAILAGDVERHHEAMQAAALEYERAGDARCVCSSRVSLAYARMELGMYSEAAEQLSAALADARRMGLRSISASALQNLGWALSRIGRIDEAITLEAQAAVESGAQGDRRLEGGSRLYLAVLLARVGDLDRAESEARAAIELLTQFRLMLADAKSILASVLDQRGRTAEALGLAREAIDMLERHGVEEGEALVRLTYAELLRKGGDLEAARRAIATAHDQLKQRAAKISSPDAREHFLTRVPEHARIMALAAELLAAPAPLAPG